MPGPHRAEFRKKNEWPPPWQSFVIVSDISCGSIHGIYIFWHFLLVSLWHSILTFYSGISSCTYSDIPSGILSGIYSDIFSGILFGILSDILAVIYFAILSGTFSSILFGILSDIQFWHSIWHLFWHSFLPFYLAFSLTFILAFFWHLFWHSVWHSIWHWSKVNLMKSRDSHLTWNKTTIGRRLPI